MTLLRDIGYLRETKITTELFNFRLFKHQIKIKLDFFQKFSNTQKKDSGRLPEHMQTIQLLKKLKIKKRKMNENSFKKLNYSQNSFEDI